MTLVEKRSKFRENLHLVRCEPEYEFDFTPHSSCFHPSYTLIESVDEKFAVHIHVSNILLVFSLSLFSLLSFFIVGKTKNRKRNRESDRNRTVRTFLKGVEREEEKVTEIKRKGK